MPKRTPIDLWLAASADLVEVAQLGGATIYSASQSSYAESFSGYMSVLDEVMRESLLMPRRSLGMAIDQRLWPVPEKKLHQAMLGAFLRVGRGDGIGCMSVNRRFYTVLVHEDRIAELVKAVAVLRLEISIKGRVNYQRVMEVTASTLGSVSVHLMAHVVYTGHADYLDRWTIGRPVWEK